jgi:hypothetical protein
MDDDNTNMYSIALSSNFHPLGLVKGKHSNEFKYPTLFYGQPSNFLEDYHINKQVELGIVS